MDRRSPYRGYGPTDGDSERCGVSPDGRADLQALAAMVSSLPARQAPSPPRDQSIISVSTIEAQSTVVPLDDVSAAQGGSSPTTHLFTDRRQSKHVNESNLYNTSVDTMSSQGAAPSRREWDHKQNTSADDSGAQRVAPRGSIYARFVQSLSQRDNSNHSERNNNANIKRPTAGTPPDGDAASLKDESSIQFIPASLEATSVKRELTSPASTGVVDRMQSTTDRANFELELKRAAQSQRDLAQCTFRPRINENSESVVDGGQEHFRKSTTAFETRKAAAMAQRRLIAERRARQDAEKEAQREASARARGVTTSPETAEEDEEQSWQPKPRHSSPRYDLETRGRVAVHGVSPVSMVDFDAQSGRGSFAHSAIPRSESSIVNADCTFHPFISKGSASVYTNGTRQVEGSLDTFTRLYSRSVGFQANHPDFAKKLRQEHRDRSSLRSAPLPEDEFKAASGGGGDMSAAHSDWLRSGSPQVQWERMHCADDLPPPLQRELEGLRRHFGAADTSSARVEVPINTDIGAACGVRQGDPHNAGRLRSFVPRVLPPHRMNPFLCNVLGIDSLAEFAPVEANVGLGSPDFSLFQLCSGYYYPKNHGAITEDESAAGKAKRVDPAATLENFVRRQEKMQQVRERKLAALTKQLAPTHTPKLSAATVALCSKRSASSHAEASANATGADHPTPQRRSASYFGRRSQEELAKPKRLPTQHYDKELTFAPTISPYAASAVDGFGPERLHDDARRRAERLKKQQEEILQKERDTVTTFRPKTNKVVNQTVFANVQSLFNPQNIENSAYKNYLTKAKKVREVRKDVQETREEEEDLRECTFRPVINRTPSYISKMSQSYSLLRGD